MLSHDLPDYRNYQAVLNRALDESIATYNGSILQMPTGTGKGNIILNRAVKRLSENQPVLIVVPNKYLVHNIGGRLKKFAPKYYNAFYHPIFSGTERIYDSGLTVGVYKSIASAIKKGDLNPNQYAVVMHDEVHHIRSNTWFEIGKFFKCSQEGYTATPRRLDGKKLGGDVFKHLVKSPPVDWFIEQGYLAPYKLFTTAKLDLTDATSFNDALDLQQRLLDTRSQIGNTIEIWNDKAIGKKTIVYATGTDHADHIAEQFNEYYKDKLVNGKRIIFKSIHSKKSAKDNDQAMREFSDDKITGLVNVDMITEGVDVENIEVVLLLRFTYSLSLYLQMVGRGLRPSIGKTLLILDQVGNALEHGSPSFDHDWDIFKDFVRKSQYNNDCECYYCQIPLITKQKVIRYGSEGVRIKCPNCGYNNHFILEVMKKERKVRTDYNPIMEGDLVQFTTDQSTLKIYKIMASKKSAQSKIHAIVDLVGVSDEHKFNALRLLEIPDSTISMYLN